MAPKNNQHTKGPWTAEEDQKLAEYIEVHGAKKWKQVSSKAGLNRCGKSCRLRWLNYLRPNIKRGNISDQEEDLILRLHKLLGNRWSLIAGRLPGRTDNEIKNYWNSHLCKKINQKQERQVSRTSQLENWKSEVKEESGDTKTSFNTDELLEAEDLFSPSSKDTPCFQGEPETRFNQEELFDFSNEASSNLEWVRKFLELDDCFYGFS